jgi:hypothetical protein
MMCMYVHCTIPEMSVVKLQGKWGEGKGRKCGGEAGGRQDMLPTQQMSNVRCRRLVRKPIVHRLAGHRGGMTHWLAICSSVAGHF